MHDCKKLLFLKNPQPVELAVVLQQNLGMHI